jgi:flagellar biosynthesis protein FlhF
MQVSKFRAGSSRSALKRVRETLGEGALVLKTRVLPGGGVEIWAAAEREFDVATSADAPEASNGAASPPLVAEVRYLRRLLEGQAAGLAWQSMGQRDPLKAVLLRQMLLAGFSPRMVRALLAALPSGCDETHARRWLRRVLEKNLPVASARDDLLAGGVFALVGPTGVGKTTTVAKLAAACLFEHGSGSVALVTTDQYRIGAVDQLRIYGELLGVPALSVDSGSDLQRVLSDLAGRRLILIDTVGMSQRDRRVAEQIALLAGCGAGVRRVLVLSAQAQATALDDVVGAYRDPALCGCILTKIDETLALGPALDLLLRHRLPLHFVTNGQRVPEDLRRPSAAYLVDRALRASAVAPGAALDEAELAQIAGEAAVQSSASGARA